MGTLKAWPVQHDAKTSTARTSSAPPIQATVSRQPRVFTRAATGTPLAAPIIPAVLVMPARVENLEGGNHACTSFRQPMNEKAAPAPMNSRASCALPTLRLREGERAEASHQNGGNQRPACAKAIDDQPDGNLKDRIRVEIDGSNVSELSRVRSRKGSGQRR